VETASEAAIKAEQARSLRLQNQAAMIRMASDPNYQEMVRQNNLRRTQAKRAKIDEKSRKIQEFLTASVERAKLRHKDFDAVAGRPDAFPITSEVRLRIQESRNPGELIYWIAGHPDAARRISLLPAKDSTRELRKVESKLPK
jgi:hypothetical protein